MNRMDEGRKMLYSGSYVWRGKDYVVIGGIHYLVRWESDSEMCLTKPKGKIVYLAPIRNGEVIGLPVTKGKFYSEDSIDY